MKLPTFHNPLKLFAPSMPALASAGANVQGGHMMFSSSGSGGGYDDDDFDYTYEDDFGYEDDQPTESNRRAPQANRNRRENRGTGVGGGRPRRPNHDSEERYWTDYLRIALPVIGIILMLGLLWVWAAQLLGGDAQRIDQPTPDIAVVSTQITDIAEPTADLGSTDDGATISTPEAQPTENAAEIPVSAPTKPPFNPTATRPPESGGDNQAGADNSGTTGGSTTPGAIVLDGQVELLEDVNVRPSPGTGGEPIRVADKGETATVISGPQDADGYTWWEVVFEDGSSGFVAEDFLVATP